MSILKRKLGAAVIASLVFLAVTLGAVWIIIGGEKGVIVALSVSAENNIATAHLSIKNATKEPVYIDKLLASADGKMIANTFKIMLGDKRVDYKGPNVKRAFEIGDYLKLLPGERITAEIKLNDYYRFPPNRNTYSITYETYHIVPEDGKESERLTKLQSSTVSFVLGVQ